MHRDVKLFGAQQALDRWRDAWDALPSQRGLHADLYDTATWLASWLAVAPPDTTSRLRIPAVFEEGRLAGVMPLLEERFGRWTIPAMGYRPRYRIVTGQEHPDEETIAALIEGAAQAGAKEFQFLAMPSQDPQTELLQQVLRRSGYDLSVSEGTTECLATAGCNWEEHAQGYLEIRRTSRKRRRKAETLGKVEIIAFGGPDGNPVSEGMEIYASVHAASWKGPLKKNTLAHRRALVELAQERGWVRLFVLELAGIAAAAHIWFRIGRRAISYSTVYDQRLATLSLGTVIQWETHEDAFTGEPPLLIDYLPGRGTYKDRLGTIKPRLLVLRAHRRTLISRLTFPIQRAVRHTARKARQLGNKLGKHKKAPLRSRTTERATKVVYSPGGDFLAVPTDITPPLDLLLAVAGAHKSPKAMRESWQKEDGWWLVGNQPLAAVRVGQKGEHTHRPVRETILFQGQNHSLEDLLGPVARDLDETLEAWIASPAGEQTVKALRVIHCPLPWPPGISSISSTASSSSS